MEQLVYDFANAYEFGFQYPESRDAAVVSQEFNGGVVADKVTLVTPERTIFIEQHVSAEGDVYIDKMVSIGKDGVYKVQLAGQTAKVIDLDNLTHKTGNIALTEFGSENYGGSFGTCVITANDVTGEANLQGLLQYNGAVLAVRYTVIGKLPNSYYAPKKVQIFAAFGLGGMMRLDISTTGEIKWIEGAQLLPGHWVSLSNINYNFKTTA